MDEANEVDCNYYQLYLFLGVNSVLWAIDIKILFFCFVSWLQRNKETFLNSLECFYEINV